MSIAYFVYYAACAIRQSELTYAAEAIVDNITAECAAIIELHKPSGLYSERRDNNNSKALKAVRNPTVAHCAATF